MVHVNFSTVLKTLLNIYFETVDFITVLSRCNFAPILSVFCTKTFKVVIRTALNLLFLKLFVSSIVIILITVLTYAYFFYLGLESGCIFGTNIQCNLRIISLQRTELEIK